MPQGKESWNPYRLVPIREPVDAVPFGPPTTCGKFQGKSGTICCTLENLTLLFIGGGPKHGPGQFVTKDKRPVIPGSSLKGVFRSLVELIGGGCSVTCPPDKKKPGEKGYSPLSDKFRACEKANYLCVACRMFGMMERHSHAKVHQGQVSFSDALLPKGAEVKTTRVDILLMTPKLTHVPFYLTPATGAFDGKVRKLYFHQPRRRESVLPIPDSVRKAMQKDIHPIHPLLPGHVFEFTVSFENLQEEEIGLLAYALAPEVDVRVEISGGKEHLELQGPMRHKIGQGKPIGMGSCKIDITSLEYRLAPSVRFASLSAGGGENYTGDNLQKEIKRLTGPYVHDKSLTMQHVRKLMVWDERDPRSFSYPEWDWFQKEKQAGRQTPLKEV